MRFRGKSWINTSQTVRKKLISDAVQKLVSVLIFYKLNIRGSKSLNSHDSGKSSMGRGILS